MTGFEALQDALPSLFESIQDETVGLIGGTLFFGSWMLQAYESRKQGKPVVSARFFMIRASASVLLAFEGYRTGSLSVFLVMAATGLLMFYNLYLAVSNSRSGGMTE